MIPPPPPSVSSLVQWVTKFGVLAVAVVLAERGTLTAEVAGVLASAILSLGITNSATLLASAARVVSILHEFTPSTEAAAVAVVESLRPPPMPPRPPPSAAMPLVVGVLLGALLVACAGGLLTPADQGAVNTEQDEQMACLRKWQGNKPEIDSCRHEVRARWDGYWQREWEGGSGQ